MDFCLCSGKRTESDCKDEPLAPWRVPSLWCVCFCVRVSVSVSCDSQCSLVNMIFISDETTRMPVLTTGLGSFCSPSPKLRPSKFTPVGANDSDKHSVPETELAGVGIVFREEVDGLKVKSCIPDGPAMQCGRLEVDDTLVSVDQVDVRNLDSLQLAPLILGPAGSTVRLGFLPAIPRDNVDGVYYVNVQRSVSNTAPDPLDACEADPCASPAASAATEGAQQEGHVWYIRKSRSSGKRYYYNATTGSTTWELPAHVPWDQVLEATDMRELHDAMSLSSLKQRLTPSVTPSSSFSSKSTAFWSSKSFSDSNTSLPQVHDEIIGRMQHETRSPTSRTPSPVRDPKTPSPVRGPKTPGFSTDRVNDCVRKKLLSELEDFTLNAKSESS